MHLWRVCIIGLLLTQISWKTTKFSCLFVLQKLILHLPSTKNLVKNSFILCFILTAAGYYVTYTKSLRGKEKSLPGGNITGYNATSPYHTAWFRFRICDAFVCLQLFFYVFAIIFTGPCVVSLYNVNTTKVHTMDQGITRDHRSVTKSHTSTQENTLALRFYSLTSLPLVLTMKYLIASCHIIL